MFLGDCKSQGLRGSPAACGPLCHSCSGAFIIFYQSPLSLASAATLSLSGPFIIICFVSLIASYHSDSSEKFPAIKSLLMYCRSTVSLYLRAPLSQVKTVAISIESQKAQKEKSDVEVCIHSSNPTVVHELNGKYLNALH